MRDGANPFRVILDDVTTARLVELADMCHAQPSEIIAAIVRDVLEDDARAHEIAPESVARH